MVPHHIRLATADDTDTIVRILIASKEASFPDSIGDHDRDVEFWTNRWREYITSGSRAQMSRGDGWVFIAEVDGRPVGYIAYHHTTRHGTDAELQNIYLLKEYQRQGIGTHMLAVVAHQLLADGSRTMCVSFDESGPYKASISSTARWYWHPTRRGRFGTIARAGIPATAALRVVAEVTGDVSLMLVFGSHPEPAHGVAFEIELDQHHRFSADHPTVVAGVDRHHLRGFVFHHAAVGVSM